MTLRDEIPALLPGPEAAALAERAKLFGELVAEHGEAARGLFARVGTAHAHGPLPPEGVRRLPRRGSPRCASSTGWR